MKKKIKSYLVFSSFSYKVCIFLLMPAVLVGIGIGIVSIFGELGLTATAMLLTMAEILSDHWLFSGLMVATCLLVWRGSFRISNVFAMVSMLSVSLTAWSDNAQVMRVNKLFLAGPLWVVYTIAAGSISNLLCECIGMPSAAAGIYRYRRNARIEKKAMYVQGGKEHGAH